MLASGVVKHAGRRYARHMDNDVPHKIYMPAMDNVLDKAAELHGANMPARDNVVEKDNAVPDLDVPRAHHDMGGVSKYICEPVDLAPHALTDFDKEVDAIRQILGMKGVMTVDELRRGVEAIPEADYHRLTYYRRWIRSITDTLLRKGVITEAELAAALAPT